jgi:hypothetical protein
MDTQRQMRYHVVADFFDGAGQLRQAFNDHFANPDSHRSTSHQVWNYWHVPRLYTYLRTAPEKVLPAAEVQRFVLALRAWSLRNLGLDQVCHPTLSLYVNGCGQGLHNDSGNGRWGYVFSLTRWEQRSFRGGETIIFRGDDYWNSPKCSRPGGGSNFYDVIEPAFNQLLVFDDRSIHAVERIEGNMDPQEGRVVLHGHIREGGCSIEGGLQGTEATTLLNAACRELDQRLERYRGFYIGVISLQLHVTPGGTVASVRVLTKQISNAIDGCASPAKMVEEILDFMRRLRFPATNRETQITIPLTFT